MPTTIDFLSGATPAVLRAGLSQQALTQPFHLADYVPADFEGYTSTELTIENQSAIVPGWGYLQASASFSYLGSGDGVDVSSLWIIATYLRSFYLVRVVPLIGTPAARLRYGQTKISFQVVGHQIVKE